MKTLVRNVAWLVGGIVLVGLVATAYFVETGLSARSEPGRIETIAAGMVRRISIRARTRGLSNPVPISEDVISEGRVHFADHCSVCHGNDGSGTTEMGKGLYPKTPDMRLPATQNLSDAELFYIIENGVRFTGMPAWSTGTKDGEMSSWHLVHFIRHLPHLTADEIERMEALNPKSPEEIRQQIEEEKFLQGPTDVPQPQPTVTHTHPGAHK